MIRRKIGNAIYPIFMYYLIELVVFYIFSFITGEKSDSSLSLQLYSNLFTLPYLLYLYKKNPLYMWVKNGKKKSMSWWVKGIAICIIAGITISACFSILAGLLYRPGLSESFEEVQRSFFDNGMLEKLLALTIVAPASEELIYRGIVFNYLKRNFDRRLAYVVSALLFGIIHMNLIQFIYAFAFGFVLAYFSEKMDTVLAAITIHFAANLISVLNQEYQILMPVYESGIFTEILFMIIMGIAGICTILLVKNYERNN